MFGQHGLCPAAAAHSGARASRGRRRTSTDLRFAAGSDERHRGEQPGGARLAYGGLPLEPTNQPSQRNPRLRLFAF